MKYEMSGLTPNDSMQRFADNNNGRLPQGPIPREAKTVKERQIEDAYNLAEEELGTALQDATCQEDIREELYQTLSAIIHHHKMTIKPEDVMKSFFILYGIKETV